jgi:hypothetical protein
LDPSRRASGEISKALDPGEVGRRGVANRLAILANFDATALAAVADRHDASLAGRKVVQHVVGQHVEQAGLAVLPHLEDVVRQLDPGAVQHHPRLEHLEPRATKPLSLGKLLPEHGHGHDDSRGFGTRLPFILRDSR